MKCILAGKMKTTQSKSVKLIIEERIRDLYKDGKIEVIDQSAHHSEHLEGSDGTNTHFDVLISSPEAMLLSRVERERKVHTVLADLYTERGLHALSIKFN